MRRVGVVEAVGLVVLLAACVGTSSPSPVLLTGEPPDLTGPVLTQVTASGVVFDYSRRNNAAIAGLVTTYSEHAWDGVDTGAVLAADRFDSAVNHAVRGHDSALVLTLTARDTWADHFTSYPVWAVVRTAVTYAPDPQPSVPHDDVLLVLRRDAATSAWKAEMIAPAEVAPHASQDRAGTTTAADVTRARGTTAAVARYLETGDVPDVYVTPGLSQERSQLSEPASGERARSARCRPYLLESAGGAPVDEALRVVRTASGVLEMLTLRCTQTRTAVTGGTLRRPAGYAAALGVTDSPAATLTQDYAITVAVSRPTRGRAIVVGTDVHPVRAAG